MIDDTRGFPFGCCAGKDLRSALGDARVALEAERTGLRMHSCSLDAASRHAVELARSPELAQQLSMLVSSRAHGWTCAVLRGLTLSCQRSQSVGGGERAEIGQGGDRQSRLRLTFWICMVAAPVLYCAGSLCVCVRCTPSGWTWRNSAERKLARELSPSPFRRTPAPPLL